MGRSCPGLTTPRAQATGIPRRDLANFRQVGLIGEVKDPSIGGPKAAFYLFSVLAKKRTRRANATGRGQNAKMPCKHEVWQHLVRTLVEFWKIFLKLFNLGKILCKLGSAVCFSSRENPIWRFCLNVVYFALTATKIPTFLLSIA